MRAAIIAAMAGELKPLVRGWQHESRNGVDLWRWGFVEDDGNPGEWVAACAGAGVVAATRAFAEVEKDGPVSFVISTGWAGALSEEFKPGRAYRVSEVVDARTGERFETDSEDRLPRSQNRDPSASSGQALGHPGVCLVTSSTVAGPAEKQRLATAYGAGMVDMEASAVARLAGMRQIPLACAKGISDGFADRLPDFNRFISDRGKFQLVRFIVFVLFRPWYWPALIRMGENSRKAVQGIRETLLDILDDKGLIRKRNAYPNCRR
jgi:adenosylhomocysteine nucleosidase